jgi:valyl-tRNA synthetase
VDKVYQLIWRSFCDWGLESAKLTLDTNHEAAREACASALFYVFEGALRLAAPMIPFVTEEIWSKIPRHPDFKPSISLSTAAFPEGRAIPGFDEEFHKWELVQELVVGIRSARQQAGVPLKDKLDVFVKCNETTRLIFEEANPWILKLTSTLQLEAGSHTKRPERCLVAVGRGFEAYVPVGSYLDFDREKLRLENEFKRVSKVVDGMRAKLSNPSFVERAPADVIELTRGQMAQMEDQLESLKKNLEAVSQ